VAFQVSAKLVQLVSVKGVRSRELLNAEIAAVHLGIRQGSHVPLFVPAEPLPIHAATSAPRSASWGMKSSAACCAFIAAVKTAFGPERSSGFRTVFSCVGIEVASSTLGV
jgi:hypothetical protein